jgi:DNA-binding NtrC family response regulator
MDSVDDQTMDPVRLPDQAARRSSVDIRTLVVDDDQDSCDLIERILKKEGYRVGTLTDPRRVEDEMRRNDVHLAIVDLKMPDLSGLDVAQIIKRQDSDCSVILMTGYATLDSAVSALRYGVVDYLKKPVREDELVGAVRRALAAKGLSLLPEEELHRNIGSAIRDLRKRRTLTLKQLAKRTGLSVSLLSQIERAESSASVTSLYKIAHALKIRLPELFARV